MTEQHTPGHWRIGNAGTAVFPPKEVFASKPRAIASNLSRADARLIAAAPELLAALEALTSTARTFRNVPLDEQQWTSLDDDALNSAFAAIAKAKE